MGMALGGKVQPPVGGVQVGVPTPSVRQALHVDLAEHRCQGAVVAGLDPGVGHAAGVDNLQSLLPLGAQVQVVLEELAEHLAAVGANRLLQLGVRQRGGLIAFQPAQQLRDPSTRLLERPRGGSLGCGGHRCRTRPAPSWATSSARPALAWSSSRKRSVR